MDDPRNRFRIVLHPSRMLALALGGAYAGAAACLLAIDLSAGVKSLIIAFLVFSAYCDLRVHAGADGRSRIREIVFHSDDDWIAVIGVGRIVRGRPATGRLVHLLAVCFSLEQPNGKKLPVLILCDMCDGDAFRDLRVWLRGHDTGGGDPAGKRRSVMDFRLGNGSRS